MSSLPTSTHPVPRPSGVHRWWVLAIVSVALLLIVIDMTVLYTALPRLTHDLAATASAKLWIVNAYALVVSGLLLGMGTLGDRLGHKQLFLSGLVVFGAASLAAAFAPSPDILIVARGGLGVGAAMMMPATLSLIRLTFDDPREQALAIGIWASVASGGAAFGPIIGGALLEHFWWGSVFLINVPIVLIALPVAWWLIPNRGATSTQPWDWLGSLLFMIGLIGVTYAIKSAGKTSPDWMSVGIAVLVGVIFLWAFVKRQQRSVHPLLDLTLFRNPVFAGAVAAALMAAAALIGMQLVFSQRLQLVMGYSPLEAGLGGLPLSLAAFVAGPIAGRLLPRMGSTRLLPIALTMSSAGMAGYLLLRDADFVLWALALVMLGLGVGSTIAAASSTIMQSAPPERAGMAASVEEVSFELGGALGVTFMGSLLTFVYGRAMDVPQVASLPDTVRDSLDEAQLVAEHLSPEMANVLTTISNTAFNHGFDAVIGGGALLLLAAAVWVRWHARKR
ncbi:MFS transporter [Pandoraea anhela]|uniref:MFS transporter n=1 Tax=Pandoraea anhela TaxID=2508295 RepID=A0A5E4VBU0_9BURK|nr:MFS transporter [Pandoraea anhela]VVE09747.1 MFS transporter [Pandoraea anhela]